MITGSIAVSGHDPWSTRGDVIGVFEIVDLQQRVIAAEPLVNGGQTRVGSLEPGGYFARATLLTSRRVSVPVDVLPGGDVPVAVMVQDVSTGVDPATPTGDGWVAGWTFDTVSGLFTPAAPGRVRRRTGTTIAMTADEPGTNVLLQWAVDPQSAMFTVVRAETPIRFAAEASMAVLDLASGLARALFTFLHTGDLPAARTLATATLSNPGDLPDPVAAIALGYYLLRSGDSRLGDWTAELVRRQPESFDAHLLHGLALMRDRTRWPGSRGQLLTATGLGLPIFSPGLRLLDDALRLLLHGTADEELTAARLRYVPYLRSCLNRPLTTFWGSRPEEPTLMPTRVPEPTHGRPMRLDGLTPTLTRPAVSRSTGKKARHAKMTIAPERTQRIPFGPYSVPLTPATPTSVSLAFPAELEETLRTPLRGAAERSGDDLMVMIGNVASGEDNIDIQMTLWLADASRPVAMQRQGSALLAAVPCAGPGLPEVLYLRGSYLIQPTRTAQRVEHPELVTASPSRTAAMAEEAERLVEVGVGWEDAKARLAEIAEQWPAAGADETAADRRLWRRFVAARQEFERRHPPTVVIDPRRRSPRRAAAASDETVPEFATVRSAELRLRDLLTEAEFRGREWDAVARAASAYCIATVVAWLRARHVPRPCRLDRTARAQLEGRWFPSEARRVAEEVATSAVAHFRDHRLAWGLWRVETGTSLVTELLDACVLALPPALRSAANRSQYRPTSREEAWPAVEANGTDPILRSAAVLRGAGYSRAEVAEVLGLTNADAVTRAVARHRRQIARGGTDV